MLTVRNLALLLSLGTALAGAVLAQEAALPAVADSAATNIIPADQQASREQLTKLFDVMRVRKQMDEMTKTMPLMIQQQMKAQIRQITAQMGGKQLTPEEQGAFDKVMTRLMAKAMKVYPADQMLQDMTPIYQRHMSRTDADAFIAFYSSVAGQHLLDAQPIIMKEYMPVVFQRMTERTAALTDEMTQEMKELMKTMPMGGLLSAPPPPPPPTKGKP